MKLLEMAWDLSVVSAMETFCYFSSLIAVSLVFLLTKKMTRMFCSLDEEMKTKTKRNTSTETK